MKINEAGMNLLRTFEGCKLEAYYDLGGVLTIGYGHTGEDVCKGLHITQARAENLLYTDLISFENGVTNLVTVPINENQFSSLVCFAYNVGLDNLKHSTLLAKVNKNDMIGASKEFTKWDHVGGQIVAGLKRRREAERDLFLLA